MTDNVSTNVPSAGSTFPWKVSLVTLMIVGTIGFLIVFLSLTRTTLESNSITPEAAFGGPLPDNLIPSLSFKTEGGTLGQFFIRDLNTKLTIFRTGEGFTRETSSGENLLTALKKMRVSGSSEIKLPVRIKTFLLSQFDPRRARAEASALFNLQGLHVPLTFVAARDDEHFAIAVCGNATESIAIVALTLNAPVASLAMEQIIRDLPFFKSPTTPISCLT